MTKKSENVTQNGVKVSNYDNFHSYTFYMNVSSLDEREVLKFKEKVVELLEFAKKKNLLPNFNGVAKQNQSEESSFGEKLNSPTLKLKETKAEEEKENKEPISVQIQHKRGRPVKRKK